MTDDQANRMVDSLEKIEKHLQAIDWKFWDLYQRFNKDETINPNIEEPVNNVETDDSLESLADIINKQTPAPAVKHTLKYPSIEILK